MASTFTEKNSSRTETTGRGSRETPPSPPHPRDLGSEGTETRVGVAQAGLRVSRPVFVSRESEGACGGSESGPVRCLETIVRVKIREVKKETVVL